MCYILTISKLAALVQRESFSAMLHWTWSLKRERMGKRAPIVYLYASNNQEKLNNGPLYQERQFVRQISDSCMWFLRCDTASPPRTPGFGRPDHVHGAALNQQDKV